MRKDENIIACLPVAAMPGHPAPGSFIRKCTECGCDVYVTYEGLMQLSQPRIVCLPCVQKLAPPGTKFGEPSESVKKVVQQACAEQGLPEPTEADFERFLKMMLKP